MCKSPAISQYPNERTMRIDELVTKIYDMKRQKNGVDNNIMGKSRKGYGPGGRFRR